MFKRHKKLTISVFVFFLLAGGVLFSPYFLLYSTDYKKADAIILLLGPDFKARHKEAKKLIRMGMADYLIISAYNKTYRIYDQGKRQVLLPKMNFAEQDANPKTSYPTFYEDTHIEIIKAEKIMSVHGLKSAIFVSSPYHMRRIKFIAGKVFNLNRDGFYFVPTSHEKAPANFWELTSVEWRKVRREYGKIVWFFIYTAWGDDIG